ncbi:MAG: hypothetical protein OXR68_04535 [Alphaproteobacteria bacterium]|nr:hypothetical protein [Alphaproteobacteria bacterium]MDD9919875.1 hypothetical protein [Alphaproteobacteria bacterium]
MSSVEHTYKQGTMAPEERQKQLAKQNWIVMLVMVALVIAVVASVFMVRS